MLHHIEKDTPNNLHPFVNPNPPLKFLTTSNRLTLLLLLIFAGCVTQETITLPADPPIPVADTEVEDLRKQISFLEQVIADKDTLIKNQQIKQHHQLQTLQKANKDAAHTQLKLHRLATKPGTASAIAETEVALIALEHVKIPATSKILRIQAHQLLETASKRYEKNQFAAAMNYVAQAKHLISTLTESEDKRTNPEHSILLEFHTPIKLSTRSTAHVRSAPGNHAKILTTVKKNTPATALACQGSWLHVQINGGEGWIFNTMLEQVKSNP